MIVKRSITIRGHRTSISVEDAFWSRLQAIAAGRRLSLAALVASIDTARIAGTNLSSAIRLFVLAEALESRPAPDLSSAEFGQNLNGA
ncbi:MAG: ribbon-helix-helix domain-containing protein [Rhizobiaceae bacterium]|nr:ribbon-helix-helix domain-containing protein [Rhizobiaceae bacterium]